jgi:DNA invertase Pin-like site-specific DNA recombinase
MTTARKLATSARTVAIAYVRVSTPGQERETGTQIEKLLQLAADKGFSVLTIEGEVQQGTYSLQEDRPVLHECLKLAKENGYKIIAVDPSRISRNAEHAKQLDEDHPGMFVFHTRHSAYKDLPWSEEVAKVHEDFRSMVKVGTKHAIAKHKRQGRKFGAPDGGKAGRDASAVVQSQKSKALVKKIADHLEGIPNWEDMTRRQIGTLLDAAGIHSARSTVDKPAMWSKGSLRVPLEGAKVVLAGRTAMTKTLATYGPHIASTVPSAANTSEEPPVAAEGSADASGIPDIAEIDALIEEERLKSNPLWGRF